MSGSEAREKSANDCRQETDCTPGSVAMVIQCLPQRGEGGAAPSFLPCSRSTG